MEGTIARILPDKGFGFIRESQTGVEYFFHRSAIKGGALFEMLRQGQKVTFTAQEESPKGPRAASVSVDL